MSKKKFYHTKEFRELQDKWYDRLSRSSFNDIEIATKKTFRGTTTPYLTPSTTYLCSRYAPTTEEYYRAARAFLWHSKFPSPLHRYIWRLHTNGVSYRKMIPKLHKRFGKSPSTFKISKIVQALKKECISFNRKSKNGTLHDSPEDLHSLMQSNEAVHDL